MSLLIYKYDLTSKEFRSAVRREPEPKM